MSRDVLLEWLRDRLGAERMDEWTSAWILMNKRQAVRMLDDLIEAARGGLR